MENPGDKKAEDTFKEISGAYYALGDEKRRKEYDNLKRMGAYTDNFSSNQGFDYSDFMGQFSGGGFSSGSPFEDLFGDIFSRSSSSGRRGGQTYYYSSGGGMRGGSQRAQEQAEVDTDIRAELPIPKNLSEKGGEAKFKLSSGKSISLKIPKGTKTGQKMRLRGQGSKCPCCNHKGDLIVSIKIK